MPKAWFVWSVVITLCSAGVGVGVKLLDDDAKPIFACVAAAVCAVAIGQVVQVVMNSELTVLREAVEQDKVEKLRQTKLRFDESKLLAAVILSHHSHNVDHTSAMRSMRSKLQAEASTEPIAEPSNDDSIPNEALGGGSAEEATWTSQIYSQCAVM
eukprot:TRINITY_DN15304_c0_g1_i2.p2 TRINITY_DN15304_c0_g1~~TRINITY_DN15304_c0_g1_i2.p2  ORF type:complete len:169 (+),score=49.63 TRINITY_DN15304_c0_g1_i2:41-508(+)